MNCKNKSEKLMEICVYEGRCLQFGRFRYDRRIVPVCVGLADFLGTYGFSIYHLGVHEYLADSGLGWRTRDVLDL